MIVVEILDVGNGKTRTLIAESKMLVELKSLSWMADFYPLVDYRVPNHDGLPPFNWVCFLQFSRMQVLRGGVTFLKEEKAVRVDITLHISTTRQKKEDTCW